MRRLRSVLFVISMLAADVMWAQTFPPNEAGVTMGHWHLNTSDVEANKKILVAMGGTAIKAGNFEVVRFPGVYVYLHLNPGAVPPAGPSVGSVVNHVGFLVQNVEESTARWMAAGVSVQPGNNGRTDQAYVVTPDGLRIEILEDRNQAFAIQNHHVHFWVAESSIPEIQAWYAKIFGAQPGMRGNNQAANLPGVNLTFSAQDMPTVTTKGRALDHIGFDVVDLEAFCENLEAAGIELVRPYTKNEQSGNALAFIYDPWGTYIELNERAIPR